MSTTSSPETPVGDDRPRSRLLDDRRVTSFDDGSRAIGAVARGVGGKVRVDVLERVEGLEADGGGHDDEVRRGLEDRLLEACHGKRLDELARLGTQPGAAVEQREKTRRVADTARAELPRRIVGIARIGERAEHLRRACHEDARVPAAALVDGTLRRRELRVRGEVAYLEGAFHVGVLAPEADVGDVGGLFCLLGADEHDAVTQSHLVGAVQQAFQAVIGVDALVCPEHGHHRVGVFAAGARRTRARCQTRCPAVREAP